MNKLFYLSLLILSALIFAADQQGIKVHVELLSGTTQNAQFLGIDKDSVNLGGYIKNQFTVVRIPKSQFKSITDSTGKNLLDESSAKPESQEKNVTDSVQVKTDSTAQVVDSANVSATSSSPAMSSLKIFSGIEPTNNQDPAQAALLTALVAKALKEADSNYHFESGKRFVNCDDNACIQKEWLNLGVKDILFGKLSSSNTPDSMQLQFTRVLYEDSLPTISAFQTKISTISPVSDVISSNKLKSILQEIQGIPPEKSKKTKSYIHVETDPEGATLSRSEKDALCKTPCTIATLDTGKIVLNAYWKVEHLWGAQTTVRAIPGDTVKVSLKLKRISPEVRVITQPVGAEIYAGSEEILKSTQPIAYTPDKFTLTDPGLINIRLRKEGYRDSLVSFYLAPVPETTISVSLEEIKDYNEFQKQKDWFNSRKVYHWGKTLMGSAIAPAVVGSIFLFLAKQNYDDASDIKDDLKKPGIPSGAKYQKKIDENHDLVKKGDQDIVIGSSLIGAGIVLFGIGFYLTF